MYPFHQLHQFSLNRAILNFNTDEKVLWADLVHFSRELNFPSLQADAGAFINWMIPFLGKKLNIFEFGSGFGHSAFWYFACNKSSSIDQVHLTERREDLRAYFEKLNWPDQWKRKMLYHQGDGLVYLQQQSQKFDMALIDGQKSSYQQCLQILSEQMKPAGLVFIDNMFWKGQILEQSVARSTQALIDLHEWLLTQQDFEVLFLPVADGVSVLRKKAI